MGEHALRLLQQRLPPAGFMDAAIREVCDAAIAKGVNLIADAEEQVVQPGIEAWTLRYQKYCSCRILPHQTTLYGTYQAYLRSLPSTLAKHIEISQCEGYTLGVKLVRGAYMNTEPRHLIWATKQETDRCYDDIVDALLTRQYNATLRPISNHSGKEIPPVKLVIATHNQESTRKAHNIRSQQATRNQPRIELAYAQLQGMADEVSYRLIHGFQDRASGENLVPLEKPNVYKLLVWGSIKECMGFLLRRAVENSEAVARTKQSQIAMATELKRRIRKSLGFPV
jgi:Proline dehydrogenase